MPQISLRISKNIDISKIDFRPIFITIHEEMAKQINVDINTCQSGVIQENFSFIGRGEENRTKVYLEILWLESEARQGLKNELAKNLMIILKDKLVPLVNMQDLICVPRIRIGSLGTLDQDYFIATS